MLNDGFFKRMQMSLDIEDREQEIYRVDRLPIFQNWMYDSFEEARFCPRGDMRLVQNIGTGLIYNAAFQPELMAYGAQYQNEQALSPLFHRHLQIVSKIVKRMLGSADLVEVGCGKGYFLEMLQAQNCDITGFDPAYEGNNSRIKQNYFAKGMGIKAKGLILRHVLEHIQNPFHFLGNLKEANAGTGLIYIEVPCFDWICSRCAWFDIFYEHVNYFRLGDFQRMFGRVLESGKLFGGQYLYVVADLSTLTKPQLAYNGKIIFPENFDATIHQNTNNTQTTAIWGGASKGVIFALQKARAGHPVKLVIDINPAKQGKYLAATGLQVHSPKDGLEKLPKNSTIYVMNSNYMDEVRAMTHGKYEYIGIDNE